jgi:CRISPR-associated protein Csd2
MAIQNRYEFLYYVSCTNANPNGDPDMGNTPRIDPETMHGFITDVATKRRIRNYIDVAFAGQSGMGIIIQQATKRSAPRALRTAPRKRTPSMPAEKKPASFISTCARSVRSCPPGRTPGRCAVPSRLRLARA